MAILEASGVPPNCGDFEQKLEILSKIFTATGSRQRGEIERPPHLKNIVGGRATVLNSTTPLYCPTLTLASNFSLFYKITLKLDLDKLQLIFKSYDFAYPHQVIKIAPIRRKWPIYGH